MATREALTVVMFTAILEHQGRRVETWRAGEVTHGNLTEQE